MALYRFAALAVCVLLCVLDTNGQTCDSLTTKCTSSFNSKYSSGTSGGVVGYSAAALAQLCTDFTAVEDCLNGVLSSCSLNIAAQWHGVIDGYNMLCSSDGQGFYAQHEECYTSSGLLSDESQCNSTFMRSLSTATTVSRICTVVDNFLYCTQTAIANRCGNDAANFQIDLVKNMFGPIFSQVGCSIYIADLPPDSAGAGSSTTTVRGSGNGNGGSAVGGGSSGRSAAGAFRPSRVLSLVVLLIVGVIHHVAATE